jgi:hypothetical protein
LLAASKARAEPIRFEGTVGFDFAARAARDAWNWSSVDSSRAELKFGTGWEERLRAFAAFSTGRAPAVERFELREAALDVGWRRAADCAAVHVFAFQPSRLWLDLPLQAPLAPAAWGGDEVHGARADAAWRAWTGTVLGVARSDSSFDAAWIGRLRWDGWRPGRFGITWMRQLPAAERTAGDAAVVDPLRRDVVTLDARAGSRALVASFEVSEARDDFAVAGATAAQQPGRRTAWRGEASRRVTDILPTTAALRAELRGRGLGSPAWGEVGYAAAYRALGRHSGSRLQAPERDLAAPRRGLEGYRLDAWYEPRWIPGWLRHVYDRHLEFGDADRRVIVQQTELETRWTGAARTRVRYQQHATRTGSAIESEDVLLADLVAEDRNGRLRVAAGLLDLDTDRERRVVVLEMTANLGARVQAVGRWTAAGRGAATEPAAFVALQYWQSQAFEASLSFGPEDVGDAIDPILDPDLGPPAESRDRVRIHVRGWF